ncbi:MAG: YbaB/EbfC family nucleoid-associated protein [Pirellulaceae bacterium]|nr:YbaB/EbfC family nucleoid-associated protein [Pirellulaceae bacterium]
MFKKLSDLASVMKQAGSINEKMQEVTEKLKHERVQGSAGAGMVVAEVNGLGEVLKITIEPDLIAKQDQEMLESLLPAAVNQAVAKSKELHVQAMQSLTGDMNLPGLDEAMSQFTQPK